MKLLEWISNRMLGKELFKTNDYEAQKEEMIKSMSEGFKVFRKPYFARYMDDYDGELNWFTIKGVKLFKIPRCFTFKDWQIKTLSYQFRLGEVIINHLPSAEAVRWGQKIKITTRTPITNTTNPQYYWTSLIEFVDGQGAHRKSLGKTIEKLGKSSMGVQFDDYNPHVFELMGDDRMDMPSFGNSMYFVVDKSYINPAYYKEYDWAVKRYNDNESPLMI